MRAEFIGLGNWDWWVFGGKKGKNGEKHEL